MIHEPYETEPVAIPQRPELEALFLRVEQLRREIADEISVVTCKKRARMAGRMEDDE